MEKDFRKNSKNAQPFIPENGSFKHTKNFSMKKLQEIASK